MPNGSPVSGCRATIMTGYLPRDLEAPQIYPK